MRVFHFSFLAMGLLLNSCQAVFTGIYGIREPKPLAASSLPRLAETYGIPPGSHNAVLDTGFRRMLRCMHQQDASVAKNHWQFLQAMYYNAAGQQQSFHINCYAGGFPNLQWERDGIMAHFPPAQQAPRDSALSLAAHLQHVYTAGLPTTCAPGGLHRGGALEPLHDAAEPPAHPSGAPQRRPGTCGHPGGAHICQHRRFLLPYL
ncbi:hypothetical protein [Hymenobacter monticola]|uniref:hypothetical protein n=1 Tax=Hymenobacter monticola TaxID=1705399 RepID=UPI0036D3FB7C